MPLRDKFDCLSVMVARATAFVATVLQCLVMGLAFAAETKLEECGLASAYSSVSEETSSGEGTGSELFTAAHRSLPFGTLVNATNQESRHSALVRVTDRGPFVAGRIIDVSQIAARELRFTGLAKVCLTIVWKPTGHTEAAK